MTRFTTSNEHRVQAQREARDSYDRLTMTEAHAILGADQPGAFEVVVQAERELLDWLASQDKLTDQFIESDYDNNGGYQAALAVRWAINDWAANGAETFAYVAEMAAESQGRGLSVPQVRGVLNCMRAAALRETREVANETPADELPFGEFSPLVTMLETMKSNGLRNPKVRIETADGAPVVLSIAGGRAYYPGSVNVTDSARYGGNFYGRIDRAGEANAPLQNREPVVAALHRLMDDPESALAAYGQRTGNCGICGRFLSNPESVARGIGPICAGKLGL